MSDEKYCLYCPEPPNSLEHPLPAAFGEFENAPLLADRICRECNRRLGLLDEQLARSGPEGFLRQFYGIKGRPRRQPVNPFLRGSAGGRRLEMKSHDENLGMEILLEVEDGVPRQLPQVIFVKDGEPHHLPISAATTPDQLRATYDELGIARLDDVHFVCSEQEKEWVEPLLHTAWPSTTTGVTGETAKTYNGAAVETRVTNRYFREIAKIGFHYFLTQFPQYIGHEPMFADIRAYILDENHKVDHANAFVGKRTLPLLGEMLVPGTRPKGWLGHVVCAEIKGGVCLAHVQLFLSEYYPAPAYTVRLAEGAPTEHRASGHLFAYSPNGPRGKYVGETHDLRGERSNIPAQPLQPVVVIDE